MAKLFWTSAVCLVVGCGGASGEVHHAKTPAEILAEQERMATQDSNQGNQVDDEGSIEDYDIEGDSDEKKPFDDNQAEVELKRAARSAETCGGVVEGGPRGTASIHIVFGNNGHVKESSIEAPFADTAVGACVLRAMDAVIVPAFDGPDKSMTWTLDVKEAEKKEQE